MKLRFLYPALFPFLMLLGVPPASAQSQSQPPAQAADASAKNQNDDPGEKSYLLRTLKFSGSVRERWEATDGPFSVTPADSYVVSQIRLGLLYEPSSNLQFFIQAQDTRPLFYQTTPSNAFSDPFDLHQWFVTAGRQEGPGFFIKAGRQDMVIGSGHLLAATDEWWVLTARNFDVVNGTYTSKYFKSQLVAGSVMTINPDGFDEHRPGDHIYADYNTFSHLLPAGSVEPYLIARTSDNVKSKDGQLGNMDTLAVGIRLAGKAPGRIDYNFEPLHEFGSYANDRLDANGLLTGVGWVVRPNGWKPRISSDFTYASGDNGKKNGTRETFDNMFGYNYPMNSLTGQFAFRNIQDLRTGVEFYPLLKVKIDGRDFWLPDTADALYNGLGNVIVHNVKATSAHVGESVEMMATASLTKTTTFGFGVGTLFPGEYLKQSGKDQAFIYPYIYFAQKF
jgi:hypothetical protein